MVPGWAPGAVGTSRTASMRMTLIDLAIDGTDEEGSSGLNDSEMLTDVAVSLIHSKTKGK